MSQRISTHYSPHKRAVAKLSAAVLALAVAGAGFAAVAVSQTVVAQSSFTQLDPADCEEGGAFYPSRGAGPGTVTDCKVIVNWRNAALAHPDTTADDRAYQGPTGHPMHHWGTNDEARPNTQLRGHVNFPRDQRRFDNWDGIYLISSGGELRVQSIQIEGSEDFHLSEQQPSPRGVIGGSVPASFDALVALDVLSLVQNNLSGSLPDWVYSSQTLKKIALSINRLSGTLKPFTSPQLDEVILNNNAFTGNLPNLDLSRLTKLNDLRLSSNNFYGPIPSSYSGFTDRPVQRLHFGDNNLRDNLPSWIGQLQFYDYRGAHDDWEALSPVYLNAVDFSYNRLCIPDNFTIPDLKYSGTNTSAAVLISLQRNLCPSKINRSELVPPAVTNLTYTSTSSGFTVRWDFPSDSSGPFWVYPARLEPQQTSADRNLPGGWECSEIATTNSFSFPSSRCSDVTNLDDYRVSVGYVYSPSGSSNGYLSDEPGVEGWNFPTLQRTSTVQDIASQLGWGLHRTIWSWDSMSQRWNTHRLGSAADRAVTVEAGTALAVRRLPPVAWLERTDIGTADSNTTIQLNNGWNLLSAGGDSTRLRETGAFFFADAFTDCEGRASGIISVIRYNARTETFDVELPCHPTSEANLIRRGTFGSIDQVSEYDALFVYFNSALPVSIRWNALGSEYRPVS